MVFFELFTHAPDIVRVAAGNTLFREGDPASCMYILVIGSAEVYVKNRKVEDLIPGTSVGEIALISASPRSGTVVATSDCEFVAINEERFNYLVQQTPFFALQVMRAMAERLRTATEMLPDLEET